MSEKSRQHYHGDLTLIGSLDLIKVGDTFRKWQPYLAVLPTFRGNNIDPYEFDEAVQREVNLYHHLEIIGSEKDALDPISGKPVRVVESEGLVTLHYDLLERLRPFLAQDYLENELIADRYVPHVTDRHGELLQIWEPVVLKSLYLIARKRKHGRKTVAREYPFRAKQ